METSYTLGPDLRILTPDLARRRLTVMFGRRAAETLVFGTSSEGAGGGDTSDLAGVPDRRIESVYTLPGASGER